MTVINLQARHLLPEPRRIFLRHRRRSRERGLAQVMLALAATAALLHIVTL